MSTELGRVEGAETGIPAESQKREEIREGFLTRGTRGEIEVRNEIAKLGPHPHILLATLLFKLCKHVLI